jgi:isopentenyl phosphate kinase
MSCDVWYTTFDAWIRTMVTSTVLVKIGGSSITDKACKETLNEEALNWFVEAISRSISPYFCVQDAGETSETAQAFIIVHGAGSFGHHTAKLFGLQGQSEPPPESPAARSSHRMHGLAATRLSVQKLNQIVVERLIHRGGINAVGISPCFAIPHLQAHGGGRHEGEDAQVIHSLQTIIFDTLAAGIVPVLHGDAGLYGNDAGILSGDTLVRMIGSRIKPSQDSTATQLVVDRAIFITDVDGVFTKDPRLDPNAMLLPRIAVNPHTNEICASQRIDASDSIHSHDVTGGLKVCRSHLSLHQWTRLQAYTLCLLAEFNCK